MIVAGGTYLEVCKIPSWSRLFGSGARAAAALGHLSPGSELFTYVYSDWLHDLEKSMKVFSVETRAVEIAEAIEFSYFHPLSEARLLPSLPKRQTPISADGAAVLRFGMVEGDAIVRAHHAVFDPQDGQLVPIFRDNGSSATKLAVVLNETEAEIAVGSCNDDAGRAILDTQGADVVAIKRGPRGVSVFERSGSILHVPAYWSNRTFKIGSGDVFSAAFAHYWGECCLSAPEAADLASRSVAHFVETLDLDLPPRAALHAESRNPVTGSPAQIYLAAPFFNLSQRWLVEEALDCLEKLGAKVFSPLHEVGMGTSPHAVASADLNGLSKSSAVFALLDGADPGSVFEVGYARAGMQPKPVVVFSESLDEDYEVFLKGIGCTVVNDFSSAVYQAFWASLL